MEENKVLAVVAGVEITQNDLEEVIMRYPEDKRGYFNNEQGKKQLLEQIIAFELFNKFGAENNIDKTEEYIKEVQKLQKDILTQMTINKILSDVIITDEDMKKSDLRTVYIQIFTLFKFDKNLKKYNRKTTLFIVK